MSYCVNPVCPKPENPDTATYCQNCHSPLLLHRRYRILKKVGQGGFGKTFLAIDEQHPLKLPCILKQISFPTLDPENHQTTARLFRREVMRLAQLGQHPQIPLLLAHFQHNQNLYLVQEYIQGLTLKQELQQQGVFNEEQIWQFLRELLPVLQFIHQRQIIHRDIKPENIIRRTSPPINYQKPPHLPGENQAVEKSGKVGEIVLIDFGVAKLLTGTALIRTGTVIGSPEYMAPEQTRGKALPASDLFSLGVTCIHLLTDVAPWDMFDVINDCWRWRDFLPSGGSVSQSLGNILDKLLQNSVSKRYQTVEQVLEALESSSNIVKQPAVENIESLALENQDFPLLPSLRSLVGRFIPQVLTLDENELISVVGVEYAKLQYLLAVQKWQEADVETWVVLCDALGKRRKSYLFKNDIDNLPCEDLLTIDHLWVKYSGGRFGFSVQKRIYESVRRDYGKFCAEVGWLSYNLHFRDRGFKFKNSAS
ncbi:MAG: serine/threonine-protein kinase, partial [Microcoleaceae cyanobacterium]